MFYTGLRSSDIYNIKTNDIDLNTGILKYYSEKRTGHREVPIHTKLIPVIRKRISEILERSLFGYSDYGSLGRAVTRYFQKIGLTEKNCSAKTFRKTFITLARSSYKMDETIVKELAGHKHSSTTDRYYNRVDNDTMKEELKKFKMSKKKKGK